MTIGDGYLIETVGPGREALLHARRQGRARCLCGVSVPPTWFAWPLTRFKQADYEKRCDNCWKELDS